VLSSSYFLNLSLTSSESVPPASKHFGIGLLPAALNNASLKGSDAICHIRFVVIDEDSDNWQCYSAGTWQFAWSNRVLQTPIFRALYLYLHHYQCHVA
jgi:hypothetical protein